MDEPHRRKLERLEREVRELMKLVSNFAVRTAHDGPPRSAVVHPASTSYTPPGAGSALTLGKCWYAGHLWLAPNSPPDPTVDGTLANIGQDGKETILIFDPVEIGATSRKLDLSGSHQPQIFPAIRVGCDKYATAVYLITNAQRKTCS